MPEALEMLTMYKDPFMSYEKETSMSVEPQLLKPFKLPD